MTSRSVGRSHGIDGDYLGQVYKDHLSGYEHWDQKAHAKEWILTAKNMGGMLPKARWNTTGVMVLMMRWKSCAPRNFMVRNIAKECQYKKNRFVQDMIYISFLAVACYCAFLVAATVLKKMQRAILWTGALIPFFLNY